MSWKLFFQIVLLIIISAFILALAKGNLCSRRICPRGQRIPGMQRDQYQMPRDNQQQPQDVPEERPRL